MNSIEGKSVETKKTEEQVASFFDVFVDKEVNGEDFNDIAGDAEFFRDELIPNSLEFYLDIMTSDFEDEDMEEGEEGEDTDEELKQAPKGGKKAKNVLLYFTFYFFKFYLIIIKNVNKFLGKLFYFLNDF